RLSGLSDRLRSTAGFEPLAVSGLLRAIAADGHAAPAARVTASVVGKEQRTGGTLAGLYVGEVFRAHELRQGLGDRDQQGFRRAPTARGLQLERGASLRGGERDLMKRLIA